ncbi:MAG TPA: glycoside hydrolase family 3 N-terminal domain-containing protein, partial [Polyangiaceae bacterium]|nr:glycoside hydrolase family 3 N-terminal domain-containing protein [Polyangiaceae bacterium]
MQTTTQRSLSSKATWRAGLGLLLLADLGCSIRPEGRNIIVGTAGSGATSSSGGASSSGGSSAMGGSSTGGMSMGGSGGTGNVGQDDPSCMAFTPTFRNNLSPLDGSLDTLINQLTPQQRIEMLSGGQELAGDNKWTIDFDGTGEPSIGFADFKMRDGPRGVHQLNGGISTTWAIAEARAAAFDLDLEFRVGKAQGEEMIALKYDLSLAPTMNVLRHPQWGRAQETYGEDPVLVGEMAAAFVNGMQDNYQMMACPKHFAVNNTENNRHEMNAVVDEQTLRENYLRNFEILVEKSDPSCIMAAYNRVDGLH